MAIFAACPAGWHRLNTDCLFVLSWVALALCECEGCQLTVPFLVSQGLKFFAISIVLPPCKVWQKATSVHPQGKSENHDFFPDLKFEPLMVDKSNSTAK